MDGIGTVTFRCAGSDVRAVLREDRTWAIASDDPRVTAAVQPVLEEIAARDHGPADGFYGARQLQATAAIFGGAFRLEHRDETPPGRIY